MDDDDEHGYFHEIRADIKAKIDRGRACLVVFENEERLNLFSKFLQSHPMQHKKSPLILSEELPNSERAIVISKAVSPCAVTLMTRTYGRGCDFVCRNTELPTNGGVHVIQTFLSELPSEEVQIKGRTGRQDNPGSYCRILHLDDLKKYGILNRSDLDEDNIDHFLFIKRDEELTKKYETIEESLQRNRVWHEKTLRFMECCKTRQTQEALTLLFALHTRT